MTLKTGVPFDVEESLDTQNNGGLWERPMLVPGQRLTVPNPGPSLWLVVVQFDLEMESELRCKW
ncbi:MAG: hypothetical protein ACRD2B_03345 [Terriglobia bacterium]